MKSTLAFSVLALACGTALAQSNVTVYGLLDAGVSRVSGLAQGTDTKLVSGIMEGSRLGFKGSEDIGGGYRALFTIEQRIEVNNGTWTNRAASGAQVPDRISDASLLLAGLPAPQQGALQPLVTQVSSQVGAGIGVNLPGAAWDRQVYVGLVTPVGAILLGRQYTPAYEVSATFDTLGTQSSLAAGQVAAIPSSIDIRANNAISYRIVQGPISASLMYALGDVPGSTKAGRLIGLQAVYKTDAFSAGLGYNQRNNELGETALKSLVLGGSAKIGPGQLSAAFGSYKDDHPAGMSTIAAGINAALAPTPLAPLAPTVVSAFNEALSQDARQYHIGYKLTTGPHTVYVAFNRLDDRRDADADTDSYGAVYSYAFSKRTDVNFVLTHFKNSGLGQAAPGQAGFLGGVTKTAGTDSNNVAVGVRHRF